MNNLEALYKLQKEIIEQYSGNEIVLTDDERKALEALFDRVNRAIETAEKTENERLRIEGEEKKAKRQLVATIISSVLGLAGSGLSAYTSLVNVGRVLHLETNDLLTKSQAYKFIPNPRI